MDVSAEAADVVVRESLQATETAARLAADGMKNIAALMVAIAKQNFKVVGETSAKRLAQENAPAVVIQIRAADMDRFRKTAKDFGVLYFIAQKKGNTSGIVNVVSNQNYAAQLNAVMEQMGYPIPQKKQEEEPAKKAKSRAPQEKSSPERGSGWNPSPTMPGATEAAEDREQKPSTRKRLEHLKKMAAGTQTQSAPEKIKQRTR